MVGGRVRKGGDRESKSAKREEHGRGKKNRRSVGKRNYRLMRRSFRHVASERESAIGRCFLAEVIRVFARSLPSGPFCPFAPFAPTLSSLSPRPRGGHAGLHDIPTPRCPLESALGHSGSLQHKIMVDPNNAPMARRPGSDSVRSSLQI